jgi:hypothetical protein
MQIGSDDPEALSNGLCSWVSMSVLLACTPRMLQARSTVMASPHPKAPRVNGALTMAHRPNASRLKCKTPGLEARALSLEDRQIVDQLW